MSCFISPDSRDSLILLARCKAGMPAVRMHMHARIQMYLLLSQAKPFTMRPAKRGVAYVAITVYSVFPRLVAITVYFLFPELPAGE